MRAFIAHSFAHSQQQKDVLHDVINTLKANGIEGFSFVLSYPPYPQGSEKQMMQDACMELGKSDLLIAEVSHKEIGIGLEIGYAKAKNIPIIYMRDEGAEYSKTVGGVATEEVVYRNGQVADVLAPILAKLV